MRQCLSKRLTHTVRKSWCASDGMLALLPTPAPGTEQAEWGAQMLELDAWV